MLCLQVPGLTQVAVIRLSTRDPLVNSMDTHFARNPTVSKAGYWAASLVTKWQSCLSVQKLDLGILYRYPATTGTLPDTISITGYWPPSRISVSERILSDIRQLPTLDTG